MVFMKTSINSLISKFKRPKKMDYICLYDYVIPHSYLNFKHSQEGSQPFEIIFYIETFTHTSGHRIEGLEALTSKPTFFLLFSTRVLFLVCLPALDHDYSGWRQPKMFTTFGSCPVKD